MQISKSACVRSAVDFSAASGPGFPNERTIVDRMSNTLVRSAMVCVTEKHTLYIIGCRKVILTDYP